MSTSISKFGGGSSNGEVAIKDGANLDAFSRLRVSNPLTLFSAQFTYDLHDVLYEIIRIGGSSTVTHDDVNRCAVLATNGSGTGTSISMQSFEYIPYQPSKSQLVFLTFNMNTENLGEPTGFSSNCIKSIGLFDDNNGFLFRWNGDTFRPELVIKSQTSTGDEIIPQAIWNLDKLDGTGGSGIILDLTKTQILVIDFQALYVGRVRMGFDIDGKIIYVHEFLHANQFPNPYIQTANLPIKCLIDVLHTVNTTMNFICSAVVAEGGSQDIDLFGYTFSQASGLRAVAPGTTFTHLLSLRPKQLFNSIINRARVAFIDVEIYNAGNQAVYWQLGIGLSTTGGTGYNNVNTQYSTVEYNADQNVAGNLTVIIDAGYVASGGSVKTVTNTAVYSRYPITLDATGNPRTMGTLSLIARSLSGTQNCYASVKFREIR
jgi:hypothetical protein